TFPATLMRRASSGYAGVVLVFTLRLPSSVFACCAKAPDAKKATAAADNASLVQREVIEKILLVVVGNYPAGRTARCVPSLEAVRRAVAARAFLAELFEKALLRDEPTTWAARFRRTKPSQSTAKS